MVKRHFSHLQTTARARDVDHYTRLHQTGIEKLECKTLEGVLKTGRPALESLGLGPHEARERISVFRRFSIQMVEEMVTAKNDTKARATVYERTNAMSNETIIKDHEYLSLTQRHGWQGIEEERHAGNMADESGMKPSS